MKTICCLLIVQVFFLTGCCFIEPSELDEGCLDQVFEETKNIPLESVYTLNTNSTFLEASNVTAAEIQSALKVEGNDFTVKTIKIVSAQVAYRRLEDNTSAAIQVYTAVVGNTFNQLLLQKKDLVLPLFDIPGLGFTDPLNINEFLNGQAITDLNKILFDYATIINDEGISFILSGHPQPNGTNANFELKFRLNLSIVYEVCRFAPIGTGKRACD